MRYFPSWLVRCVFPTHRELAIWRIDKSCSCDMPPFLFADKANGRAVCLPGGEKLYACDIVS